MSDESREDDGKRIGFQMSPELSEDIQTLKDHLERTGARRFGPVTRALAIRHAIVEQAARIRAERERSEG